MSSLTIPLKTRVKETLAIGNWPAFFTADLAVLIHGMRLWQKSCLWAHEELRIFPSQNVFPALQTQQQNTCRTETASMLPEQVGFFLLPALLHDCSAIEQSPSKNYSSTKALLSFLGDIIKEQGMINTTNSPITGTFNPRRV